jgi:hypothetical protein
MAHEEKKYFSICRCSGPFDTSKLSTTPAPTPFLATLAAAIDWTEIAGYDFLSNPCYRIVAPLPDDSAAEDVQACLDFLQLESDETNGHCRWSFSNFVWTYLGIEHDSVWDYLLMNYITNKDYADHGAGIGASWANPSLKQRVLSKDADKVKQWMY